MTYFASVFRDQVKYSFKRVATGLIVVIGMVIGVGACEKEKKPEGILTENEMVKVLSEIYLIEEKMGRVPIPKDSVDKIFSMLKEKALERAKVTDSVFGKSMNYYMANPVKLEYIYTALVDSLNLKEQTLAVDSTQKSNELPQ